MTISPLMILRAISSPLMMTLFLLLLAAVGYLIWQVRQVGKIRQLAISLLEEMEESYRNFVKQRLHLAILEDRPLTEELPKIQEEVNKILAPELSAAQDFVENYQGMKLNLAKSGQEFRALYRLMDRLLDKKSEISSAEIIEKLQQSLQQSIEADLLQRVSRLQLGDGLLG